MYQHPIVKTFSTLLDFASPSGHEATITAAIADLIIEIGYEPEHDAAGNLIVRLAGRHPTKGAACLAAHMDEIGMVVNAILPDGRLSVKRSGGLFPWKLGEGPVEIVGEHEPITGVLSMGSTHRQTGNVAPEWADVRVLTGLSAETLMQRGIKVGSGVVPIRSQRGPVIFGDGADPMMAAWTFDDRMGVICQLELLKALKESGEKPYRPTIVAFTVGEEVGGLGAKALASRERPEIFISVDGSPIPPGSSLLLDGRPAMWAKDRLATFDRDLMLCLDQAATRAGTAIQRAVYEGAACDASLVSYAGLTDRIACFGHVRENSHGYEVARLAVFQNVVDTLLQFITNPF